MAKVDINQLKDEGFFIQVVFADVPKNGPLAGRRLTFCEPNEVAVNLWISWVLDGECSYELEFVKESQAQGAVISSDFAWIE
jgi:hypothetical protein